jgi:hypothetical protein
VLKRTISGRIRTGLVAGVTWQRTIRAIVLTVAALVIAAGPARAQFTTFYKGVQRDGQKESPATAQFSVEEGRGAMIMKGARSSRMLFFEKEQVLRIVDDDRKAYFDLGPSSMQRAGADVGAAMANFQKMLDQMPPEQRKMAEAMMPKSAVGSTQESQTVYVRTNEKKTISGYETTRVEARRGDAKVSEYWGTTSSDLKMTPAERRTMLTMQGYLRNFLITVRSADGGGLRAFEWDTSVDGFPVITRCFRGAETTLDLTLDSFHRKPLPDALFAVPPDYQKMATPGVGH